MPYQNVLAPFADEQPKRGGIENALGAVARGFIGPEGVAQIEDRRFELKKRDLGMQDVQRKQMAEKASRALAWMENTAKLPPEQRGQFTAQNAQAIAQETGQPVEAIIASAQNPNAFSDEALQQGMAKFRSMAGQGPAPGPEPYTLAPGAQRFEGGRMVADNPRADKPPEGFTLSPGQTRYGPDGKPLANVAPLEKGNGIQLDFGEGGALSGLSIGGSGLKGKEPAIIRGPDGKPVVSPGTQQLTSNKSWNALKDYEAQNKIVVADIDRALKATSGWTTGLVGAAGKGIPGTPQYDLSQLLDTIKANIGFDKLAAMRAQSPTGGALGQVSDFENRLLQSVQGALEQSQSQQQFEFNLNRLKDILSDTEGRRKKAFAQDYPDLAQYAGFAAGTQAQGQQLNKRIRNQQTGEEMILQNGQWVKVQ